MDYTVISVYSGITVILVFPSNASGEKFDRVRRGARLPACRVAIRGNIPPMRRRSQGECLALGGGSFARR